MAKHEPAGVGLDEEALCARRRAIAAPAHPITTLRLEDPLDDLEPLGRLLGGAAIVPLGLPLLGA